MKWIIILLTIILVSGSGCIQQIETTIPPQKYCEKDIDCVPATCCHATETINKNYAPDCSNTDCTEECGGPLDCGCGKPICENNKCGIKKISSESWCDSFFD